MFVSLLLASFLWPKKILSYLLRWSRPCFVVYVLLLFMFSCLCFVGYLCFVVYLCFVFIYVLLVIYVLLFICFVIYLCFVYLFAWMFNLIFSEFVSFIFY
jgi:hypothetical protein